MRNFAIVIISMLAVMYFLVPSEPESANNRTTETAPQSIGPAETFTWQGGQPIRFQPPQGWQAGRYQQAGRNGVDYIRKGQRIAVTEFTRVGALDGCARLQEVLTKLDTDSPTSLRRGLRTALYHPDQAEHPKEASLLRDVKEYVDRATKALDNRDLVAVRRQIDNGLHARARHRFLLADYLEDVRYNQTVGGDIKRVDISPPVDTIVGGEPARRIDYEVDIKAHYVTQVVEKTETGREIYVMASNRLFVLSFQGRPENLPLFEQIVASVSFPPGPCSI